MAELEGKHLKGIMLKKNILSPFNLGNKKTYLLILAYETYIKAFLSYQYQAVQNVYESMCVLIQIFVL